MRAQARGDGRGTAGGVQLAGRGRRLAGCCLEGIHPSARLAGGLGLLRLGDPLLLLGDARGHDCDVEDLAPEPSELLSELVCGEKNIGEESSERMEKRRHRRPVDWAGAEGRQQGGHWRTEGGGGVSEAAETHRTTGMRCSAFRTAPRSRRTECPR